MVAYKCKTSRALKTTQRPKKTFLYQYKSVSARILSLENFQSVTFCNERQLQFAIKIFHYAMS